MSADSSTLRPYVLPRLNLVDLASRSGLRGEDVRKLNRFLQGEPSTSTSNVETGTAFTGGSMRQAAPPPPPRRDAEAGGDDPDDEDPDHEG